MATTIDNNDHHPADNQKKMYEGMMRFGYVWGIPLGGAIAMFFALLLMKAGIPMALIIAFFTWLGTLGIAKTFFVH